ncbi:MAG: alanine racemase [Patescibacteria group bacterium]|nr:alanine racemase [Patescibacteria group bacterium]
MQHKNITWVEVSKSAIQHNIRTLKKILRPGTRFMAIVKSNAYGHGFVEVSRIATRSGVDWLGTVNLEEAFTLRSAGIHCPILVLSYFNPRRLARAIQEKIRLPVYGLQSALQLNSIARRLKKKAIIHIKVDTGTSRLGIPRNEVIQVIKRIARLEHITIEGIFSHLADAENPDQRITAKQLRVFEDILAELNFANIDIPLKHIACSAATILNIKSHYDIVRIGISLYGLQSIEKNYRQLHARNKHLALRPALSWFTTVIQTKKIPAGFTIGYGCTYRVARPTVIALIPVGYWDGYDRKLSNAGTVLIRGIRCPIRGRVCMNLCMVDITAIPSCKPGDRVTLIGKDRTREISADELAIKAGTINYEIVTRINPQIPRIFV